MPLGQADGSLSGVDEQQHHDSDLRQQAERFGLVLPAFVDKTGSEVEGGSLCHSSDEVHSGLSGYSDLPTKPQGPEDRDSPVPSLHGDRGSVQALEGLQ